MTDFTKMMQEAVELKKAVVAKQQTKFRSHPEFLQHTIFGMEKEEIRKFRYRRHDVTLEQRLTFSFEKKEEANGLLGQGQLPRASLAYEAAIGCFYYVHSRNPTWRTKGFEDDDLSVHLDEGQKGQGLSEMGHAEVEYSSEVEGGISDRIRAHLVVCLNNLAILQTRQKKFSDAVETCDEVLKRDARNVKAIYRKAFALTEPASCSKADTQNAMKCIQKALEIDPSNHDVLALAAKLAADAAQDAKTDLKYKGFLTKGHHGFGLLDHHDQDPVRGGGEEESSHGKGTWKSQTDQAEYVIASMRMRGDIAEANALEYQLDEAKAKKFFVEWLCPRSFSDSVLLTPKGGVDTTTLSAAQALRLDLSRPHVLKKIQSFIEEREAKALALMSESDVTAELMACGEDPRKGRTRLKALRRGKK